MAISTSEAPDVLWRHPDPKSTRMYQLKSLIEIKYKLSLPTYKDLYEWSITDITKFWEEVWYFLGVKVSEPMSHVRSPTFPSTDAPEPCPVTLRRKIK
jgi:acetoacetyl-CoA synthetase